MRYNIFFIILISFIPLSLKATIIYIPDDFLSIQEGIDEAVNSDTVLVAPGTYRGEGNRDIDFLGKAIVVMSEDGPEATVIDSEGSDTDLHRGFTFHNLETLESRLDGFTIQGGYVKQGGGIYCHNASPTIFNCIVRFNRADPLGWMENGEGGGIYCYSSLPVIDNCTISNNIAQGQGITYTYGGGIFCLHSSPFIKECIIIENESGDFGGGIDCGDDSNPTIVTCIIDKNMTDYGGGINSSFSSPNPSIIPDLVAKPFSLANLKRLRDCR